MSGIGFNMGQDVSNSATWVNVTGNNAVLPNRFVLDVATDPLDPLIGYAVMAGFDQNTPTTPGHVFQVKCTASCASFTWRNVSGNLPNIPVNSVIVNRNYPPPGVRRLRLGPVLHRRCRGQSGGLATAPACPT